MPSAPSVDGVLDLTPHAEEVFRRECERVGGVGVDRDEVVQRSAAANFWADAALIVEAVIA
jgi:hypothetical protein